MSNVMASVPARVLVTGGAGFVGRHVCEKLARLGVQITVPTRRRARAQCVQHLPGLHVQEANLHDASELRDLVRGHDAVIHLVAVLHGDATRFHQTHVQLVEKLVNACQTQQVRRLVHVSAVGVREDAPSLYLRSKAAGEACVLRSGLDVSVLRPSVIFGADDQFTQLFAKLQRLFPVMPLGGAEARFQPVWVEDVATALIRLLVLSPAHRPGPVIEAVGPEVMTLARIVRTCGARVGCARPIVPLPEWMALLQAAIMECLPGEPLMSRDNVRSMRVPNVTSGVLPTLADLGIRARRL